MEAPIKGLSMAELNGAIKDHSQRAYKDTNEGLLCRECGTKIEFTTCHVSIHTSEPGGSCEGFGEVQRFPLPYCPTCEGVPKSTSTCMHTGTDQGLRAFAGLLETT